MKLVTYLAPETGQPRSAFSAVKSFCSGLRYQFIRFQIRYLIRYPPIRCRIRYRPRIPIYPGEVIGSGTVGAGCLLELTKSACPWLQPGDKVELEIERIGKLRNKILSTRV